MNKDNFIKALNERNNKLAELTYKNNMQTTDTARNIQKYALSHSPNKTKLFQNTNNTYIGAYNKKNNNLTQGVLIGPKFYLTSEKKKKLNHHSDKNCNDPFNMLASFDPAEVIIANPVLKHHFSTQQKKPSPESLIKRMQLRNSKDFKNLQKCLFPPTNLQKKIDTPKTSTRIDMFKTQNNFHRNQSNAKSSKFLQKQEQQENQSLYILRKSSNVQAKMKSLAKQTKLKLEKNKNFQLLEEQQRIKQLEIKKNLSEAYSKPFNPPINMTAYSYIIYEPNFSSGNFKNKPSNKYLHSHKLHLSFNCKNSVEVASLTKIMTCIAAIQLCEKLNLDPNEQQIHIGKFESNIGGTSANISKGQIYTLQQLLYGLMLPSGNDASLAIAVWGGRLLLHFEEQKQTITTAHTAFVMKCSQYKKKQCYNRFLAQMNAKAKEIGLQKTNYANSHGLINIMNKSCSYDIAILCQYALSNEKFQNIVSTKQYQCQIKFILQDKKSLKNTKKTIMSSKKLSYKTQQENDVEKQLEDEDIEQEQSTQIEGIRSIRWQNTHLLLHEKPNIYVGIKTGITTAAGPCLASCVQTPDNRKFIIVVLGCKKLSYRFKQTQILRKWIFKKQGLLTTRKQYNSKTKFSTYREQSDSESQDYL